MSKKSTTCSFTETKPLVINGFPSKPAGGQPRTKTLIVTERRDFIRGCLASWLATHSDEFETLPVADIEAVLDDDTLPPAAAVLVGIGRAEFTDPWLDQQIAAARARWPDVPIALLLEATDADDARAADALVGRLGVQAYIPTVTSLKVAAAALRLVLAGGHYFPTLLHLATSSELVSTPTATVERFPKLTPREQAVLSVLAVGAQNKIIAHRLGMSMSTVKAHVHSIISKLKVRNRTEAVVAARAMQAWSPRADGRGDLRQAV